MSKEAPYMEHTEIAPERTAGEITSLLIRAGRAKSRCSTRRRNDHWAQVYDGGDNEAGDPAVENEVPFVFRMPVRTEPIHKILCSRSRSRGMWLSDEERKRKREQAERVAWRQMLRWCQAQLAMIETGMAQAREVFLPYATKLSGCGSTSRRTCC